MQWWVLLLEETTVHCILPRCIILQWLPPRLLLSSVGEISKAALQAVEPPHCELYWSTLQSHCLHVMTMQVRLYHLLRKVMEHCTGYRGQLYLIIRKIRSVYCALEMKDKRVIHYFGTEVLKKQFYFSRSVTLLVYGCSIVTMLF